jgi:hypothetical protein
LWGVLAGVSEYRGEGIRLKYAAKDAEDFAAALALAGERLLGRDRVHLAVLTTARSDPAARPTRANLARAFEEARAAEAQDLLVVYLAGHGVVQAGKDGGGDFHFLAEDARTADLSDPAVRAETSISSRELTDWLNQIPANKHLLVFDACASGKAIEKMTEKRSAEGDSERIRALELLKDRTGTFLLAGCAADRVSYEATRYGQGLLTYSLLLGMRGGALRNGEFVDAQRLLDFAQETVPTLARDLGGVQQPQKAMPRGGGSFDLGRLLAEDLPRIPVRAARPLFLRSNFQDAKRYVDVLGLARLVDRALDQVAARGGQGSLVFVDAAEMPDAYQIGGRYSVADGRVLLDFSLLRGTEVVADFHLEGSTQDLPDLAARAVEAARSSAR